MSVRENLAAILQELSANQERIDEDHLQSMVEHVLRSNHIFLAGAGRSGVAIRGFANRLMHLGKSVSLVGDITSPHSRTGDLLIIGSGSGETESLLALARKAHRSGVRIGLVTMDPESSIARLSDAVVVLPGVSPKLKGGSALTSIQPMGSAFEQISLLTYDALILELMARMDETTDTMFPRHADLE